MKLQFFNYFNYNVVDLNQTCSEVIMLIIIKTQMNSKVKFWPQLNT